MIARGYGWVVPSTGFDLLIALGFALEGPGSTTETRSAALAAVVLVVWVAVMLAAGGWRTVARDA